MPEPARPNAVLIDPADNVVTVTCEIPAAGAVTYSGGGTTHELTAMDAIPSGHKVARHVIDEGGIVRKYGEAIGRATRPIAAGRHVHAHNVQSLRAQAERL